MMVVFVQGPIAYGGDWVCWCSWAIKVWCKRLSMKFWDVREHFGDKGTYFDCGVRTRV